MLKKRKMLKILGFSAFSALFAHGQAALRDAQLPETSLKVEVQDASGALIRSAEVSIRKSNKELFHAKSGDRGQATFRGMEASNYVVAIHAEGFTEDTRNVKVGSGVTTLLRVRLNPAEVLQQVNVQADTAPAAAGSMRFSGDRLAFLPTDHDQLAATLQSLAAFGGGMPGHAEVRIDGFLSANGSIPPHASIREIRINPDLFAAEYEQPPYRGGLIEIDTRPGTDRWHGRSAISGQDSIFNARDPFAPERAPSHSVHLEGSLEGPLVRNRSDISVSFEQRSIDRFAIVDAVVADASGSEPFRQNVNAPQRFWNGFAQVGLAISPVQTLRLSYSAQHNTETNAGVGAFVLPASGDDTSALTQEVHLSHSVAISLHTLNELRVGVTLSQAQSMPGSTAAAILVPGFFQGGGSNTQFHRLDSRRLQIQDIATVAWRNHIFRAGLDLRFLLQSEDTQANFNGSYVFGGVSAPQLAADGTALALPTVYISGLEQYRRTLLRLPGGQPTEYQVTSGIPTLSGRQWRTAVFLQDQIRLSPRTELTLGLRLQAQTLPASAVTLNPRIGVNQSLDRKHHFVVGAHVGLFEQPTDLAVYMNSLRLSSGRQTQQLIYSPAYITPLVNPATPVLTTNRMLLQTVSPAQSAQVQLSTEIALPYHLKLQSSYSWTNAWHSLRSQNLNAPEVLAQAGQTTLGNRPFAANANQFAYTADGRLRGRVFFAGLTEADSSRMTTFLGYVNVNFRTNADTPDFFPQSSQSDAGEWQRPLWQVSHRAFLVERYVFPYHIEASTIATVGSGSPANVLTGTDNNMDGVFNDRPDQLPAAQAGSVTTALGIFNPAAINGNTPRNLLTGPYTLQVDGTLSRAFALHFRSAVPVGTERPTFTLTARAFNLTNHQNATSIEGTLLSPFFGRANSADPGRRFEFGAAFTF